MESGPESQMPGRLNGLMHRFPTGNVSNLSKHMIEASQKPQFSDVK